MSTSLDQKIVFQIKKRFKKRIFWFSSPGEKTEIAIVYIHGYSASPQK